MGEIKKKLKILIVDDDKLSRMLLAMRLEELTEDLICATDGTDAIVSCRNNPDIDLIMMDLNMCDMDGYEAVRHIREFNENVIIIAQTATDLSMEREKAISCGFNDFVLKPVTGETVFNLIHKHSHIQTSISRV
jgi:CheY-like chemotaxis protein